MHADDDLTVARVRRVLSERVRPAVHGPAVDLEVSARELVDGPVGFADAVAGTYEPHAVGASWGPAWGTTWFRLEGAVPADWSGRRVEAVVDLGFDEQLTGFQCEGLVHDADGRALKALNPRSQWVRVTPSAAGGEHVVMHVEAAANPVVLADDDFRPTDLGDPATAPTHHRYRLRRAQLAVLDEELFGLAMDLEVLVDLQAELPPGPRRARVLQALDDALDVLALDDLAGTAAAARTVLAGVLSQPASASAHRLAAVGHAHIDSAWLWPVRETVRKVRRTLASTLALVEESEGFLHGMSSAQQWDWVRRSDPAMWERLRAAVADGRVVPLGGMWVESDTVMPSGEALVRQFLHGQRWFEEHLGVRCRGVWLPDSFGYSPALPQVAVDAGFEWFLTQKISWNRTNDFPHHAFHWEGIDGTSILTHFPPIDTYNATLTGGEVAHAARRFHENRVAPASLAPTGHGDGGGGATREMLARAERLADLEGSARVAWQHPDDFFDELAAHADRLPTWSGELYLELHRGTLTSQHAMKAGNRLLEELLVEAELWSATAAERVGLDHPHDELDAVWQEVLLHQFHDILPGTSIAWVHREARERYRELEERTEAVTARAVAALVGEGDRELVANGARVPRAGVLPGAVGAAPTAPAGSATLGVLDGSWTLANEHLRVEVSSEGLLVSVRDLASGREVVAPGRAANLLQLHEDLPVMWDAWDVDAYYRGSVRDLRQVDRLDVGVEDGVATVRVRRTISDRSRVVQVVRLAPGSREVDLEQVTEWHEDDAFLKLAFPLDVQADVTRAATQFGHVARPTHVTTSWDAARFETSMHGFVHVAEPGLGVALTNDSTYGFDAARIDGTGGWGVELRASVLRAPRFPDPTTDRGTHHHRFGLVVGDLDAAAHAAALRANRRRCVRGGADVPPLVRVDGRGVALSCVTRAADRSGDLVVRVHEQLGGRASGRLVLDLERDVVAQRVTVLEEEAGHAVVALDEASSVPIDLRPFEVQTWRFATDPGAGAR